MKPDADEVFHEPAIATVALVKRSAADPTEFRLPAKVAVEPVSVSTADQAILDAKLVVTPGLTVRLESA